MGRRGIDRRDRLELTPHLAGLVEPAEMRERGGQIDARQVGAGIERDALAKHLNRLFHLAREKIAHRLKVQVVLLEGRVEPDGLFDIGQALERLALEEVHEPAHVQRQREVRVERERLLDLVLPALIVLFEHRDERVLEVQIGIARILRQALVNVASGPAQIVGRVRAPLVLVLQRVNLSETAIAAGIGGVELDGTTKPLASAAHAFLAQVRGLHQLAPAQEAVMRLDPRRCSGRDLGRTRLVEIDLKSGDDLARHIVLHLEDVGELAIIALGPEVTAGHAVDQLRGDAHPLARLAY